MLNKDLQRILDNQILLRFEEYKDFKSFCIENHLLGYSYKSESFLAKWPQIKTENLFKNFYLKTTHRNSIFLDEIIKFKKFNSDLFSKHVTLLKGISLIQGVYNDPGRRWMSDVDLLIDVNCITEIRELLTSCGYVEFCESKWSGDDFKYLFHNKIDGMDITVEVHTRLFYHVKDSFSNSSYVELIGFQKLDFHDEFIHLVGHLIFQHTFLSFYWTLDCLYYFLIYESKFDYKYLKDRAIQLQLFKSLQIFFYMLEEYFGHSLPSKVEEMFFYSRNFIWKDYFNERLLFQCSQKSSDYILFKNMTKDKFSTSFIYNLNWIKNRFNG